MEFFKSCYRLAALFVVLGFGDVSRQFASALMTKVSNVANVQGQTQSLRRHCSLQERMGPKLEGRYTYDACNSMRAKDVSLVKLRQPAVHEPCAKFRAADGCACTASFNCPGQLPLGSDGEAQDDGNVGYRCCCTNGLWNAAQDPSASGVVTATETSPAAAELDRDSSGQLVVWVSGYPRSGSSTMLSMVSAASGHVDARVPGETFSLFEPCHNGDELDPALNVSGCTGLLGSI